MNILDFKEINMKFLHFEYIFLFWFARIKNSRRQMSQTHLKSFNDHQWDLFQSISGVLDPYRGLFKAQFNEKNFKIDRPPLASQEAERMVKKIKKAAREVVKEEQEDVVRQDINKQGHQEEIEKKEKEGTVTLTD